MEQVDDDEWEYVYHPTETETLTFTVDFSTTSSGSAVSTATSNEVAGKASDVQSQDVTGDQIHPANVSHKNNSPSTVQFLDLPSKSPYISYQGQVFTGTWGETLGSDLIFASTKDVPDVTPVIQGKDGKWCLLGVSQTTLVAKPVELVKRSRLGIPITEDGNGSTNKSKVRKRFTVILKPDADAKLKRQAEYLEQLQAVKIARGDTDTVYLGKAMQYLDSKGKQKKAPDFQKRDLDKMNEEIVSRSGKRLRNENGEDEEIESEQDLSDGPADRGSDAEMSDADVAIDPNLEDTNVEPEIDGVEP